MVFRENSEFRREIRAWVASARLDDCGRSAKSVNVRADVAVRGQDRSVVRFVLRECCRFHSTCHCRSQNSSSLAVIGVIASAASVLSAAVTMVPSLSLFVFLSRCCCFPFQLSLYHSSRSSPLVRPLRAVPARYCNQVISHCAGCGFIHGGASNKSKIHHRVQVNSCHSQRRRRRAIRSCHLRRNCSPYVARIAVLC